MITWAMRGLQPWRFFCVIAPGLEDEARAEWDEKKSQITSLDASFEATPGGFEITLPWNEGRGLAHVLKIPTRILVRLTSLTARDFPKMYQKVATLPWTQWLSHPTPEFKIAAHQCRLMHTGRVEETLKDAMRENQKRQPLSTRYQKEDIQPETLYVRGVNDEWSFSLDLCGDPLYKRGTSEVKGAAPMRETLAAFCLRLMFKAPPTGPVTLWDPMCGSGTLLFEALNHFTPLMREMNYQKSILNLGVPAWKPKTELSPWPISHVMGSDVNSELIKKLLIQQQISWKIQDFLAMPECQNKTRPLWIISNPPYGERLEFSEGRSTFFERYSRSLQESEADKILLITPKDWPHFKIKGLNLSEKVSFSNGGLMVEARIWQRATTSR